MEASKEDLQCNSKTEESTTTSRDGTLSEESVTHPTRRKPSLAIERN
jgi:hypothetical protein